MNRSECSQSQVLKNKGRHRSITLIVHWRPDKFFTLGQEAKLLRFYQQMIRLDSWVLQGQLSWVLQGQFSWVLQGQLSWVLQGQSSWVLQGQFSWVLQRQFSWVLQGQLSWVLQRQFSWVLQGLPLIKPSPKVREGDIPMKQH